MVIDLNWCRRFYDWENEELQDLKNLIEQKMPQMEVVDGVKWNWSGECYFPIKNIFEKSFASSISILSRSVINSIWKNSVPPTAQLILWMANLEKLKTGNFLAGKGIIDAQQPI